jgi:hypothetical protein
MLSSVKSKISFFEEIRRKSLGKQKKVFPAKISVFPNQTRVIRLAQHILKIFWLFVVILFI